MIDIYHHCTTDGLHDRRMTGRAAWWSPHGSRGVTQLKEPDTRVTKLTLTRGGACLDEGEEDVGVGYRVAQLRHEPPPAPTSAHESGLQQGWPSRETALLKPRDCSHSHLKATPPPHRPGPHRPPRPCIVRYEPAAAHALAITPHRGSESDRQAIRVAGCTGCHLAPDTLSTL